MPRAGLGARRRRARVDRARAVGLLDARRLPELGHRPGLQALAPGQEARAQRSPRCSGSRCARSSSAQAPWAKHMLDRSFELFDRWTERRPRAAARERVRRARRSTTTSPRRCSTAARVQANAAQAALFGLGEDAGRGAAAAVRLRPRRRPPRRHHARVQHGDRGRHARRVPVRRHRARAAVRPRAGRRGRRRRAPAGVVRGRRAQRRRDRRTPPSARSRRPTRRRCGCSRPRAAPPSNPQPYPNRPYAGAFETLRVRGAAARGGIEIRTTHTLQGRLHRDRVARDRRERQADRGRCSRAGATAPRSRRS